MFVFIFSLILRWIIANDVKSIMALNVLKIQITHIKPPTAHKLPYIKVSQAVKGVILPYLDYLVSWDFFSSLNCTTTVLNVEIA